MTNTHKARAKSSLRTAALKLALPSALVAAFSLGGCAVVAVADAAVTVVATGVKVTAKVAGAAVDAVIPDSKEPRK